MEIDYFYSYRKEPEKMFFYQKHNTNKNYNKYAYYPLEFETMKKKDFLNF